MGLGDSAEGRQGRSQPFPHLPDQARPGRGAHGSRGLRWAVFSVSTLLQVNSTVSRCRGPCPQLEGPCLRFSSGVTFSGKHSRISHTHLCVPSSFPKRPVTLCFTPLTHADPRSRPADASVSACRAPGAVLGTGGNAVSEDVSTSLSSWSTCFGGETLLIQPHK